MFEKILIANRGEITCRIIKTCRRLGIRTVAVYSEADADALHVELADEAFLIGSPAPKDSYLRGKRIIEVGQKYGAQAIHPGFGFLSENAEFAESCEKNDIKFIGPSSEAIRVMGSKHEAKRIMQEADVPVVPGYHGENQDIEHLKNEADQIGYPVLIKASAGGGGKGMRRVDSASDFTEALEGAKREAANAFGNDHVLIEKFLERPRHVEIQVFADSLDNYVYLFERECSIQRRHQKIVEEAPSTAISARRREMMGSAAVSAARAVGYHNAGTVEFILDSDGNFYFMEMNTRLQVEHPVTEMITGLDLVEWQLLVASGEPLPLGQENLSISGHAIECRVYAEDPEKEFLPTTGLLSRYRLPEQNVHVRVDTGVREGDVIGTEYDPMIAKLIAWDFSRSAAIRRMKKALMEYTIAGLPTNLNFLSSIISHPAFEQGSTDTHFIPAHREDLLHGTHPANHRVLALATLYVLLNRQNDSAAMARSSYEPNSPWHLRTGWRLNEHYEHHITFLDWGREVDLTIHFRPESYSIEFNNECVEASGELNEAGDLMADIGGARVKATVVQHGKEITVVSSEGTHRLMLQDPVSMEDDEAQAGNVITASMPGTVTKLHVREGDSVERGQALIVLEAMKMEHTMTAHASGRVATVHYAVGDRVSEDEALIELEIAEEE